MIPINVPIIGEEEIRLVLEVLKSGVLTSRAGSGSMVAKFEEEFAKFVGAKYAVAANSGTAALHMALLAAGIGPGDDVLVPSFTFVATAEAVVLAGARPIFVDIEPETYCIDPTKLEDALTEKTKAIIPVDLYGLPADLKPILDFAEEHDLTVIEDAAQAHGAEYNNRKVGSVSHMTCFSFYPSKNMTTGEGGMVTTNVEEYAEKLRAIRSHGEKGDTYYSVMVGHNYRMPEIPAAIGLAQLKKLPKFLQKRRENAKALTKGLEQLEPSLVRLPKEPRGRRHSWYLYTIRLPWAKAEERNRVIQRLRSEGIAATTYYQTPIHKMPPYKKYPSKNLKETEKAAQQVLSLPTHPALNKEQLNHIAKATKEAIKNISYPK